MTPTYDVITELPLKSVLRFLRGKKVAVLYVKNRKRTLSVGSTLIIIIERGKFEDCYAFTVIEDSWVNTLKGQLRLFTITLKRLIKKMYEATLPE